MRTVGEEETNTLLKSRELLFFADQEIEGARSSLRLKPISILTSPPTDDSDGGTHLGCKLHVDIASRPTTNEGRGVTRPTLKSRLALSSATHQDNRGAKPRAGLNPIQGLRLPLTRTVGEEETNMLLKSRELLSFADQEIEGVRSIPYLKPIYPMASPPLSKKIFRDPIDKPDLINLY